MANKHSTLASLFENIADAIRSTSSITEELKADAFPAYILAKGRSDCPATPSVLNSCPWSFISWASDEGIADLLWNVGDRKAVPLGAFGVQNTTYQVAAGTYYCYILGFNHNADKEGANRIHFSFGFDAPTGGHHIAFTGKDYTMAWGNNTSTSILRMNKTQTNAGGWAASEMRIGALNGTARSLKTAMPSDLIHVLKTVEKYTDNVGGGKGNVASNVTATTDTIFLMNVNECRGSGLANTYEANYTKQYQYYKNGNSQKRVRSDDISSACKFIFRSPSPSDAKCFMGMDSSGGVYLFADNVYAIAPCFCV